MKTTGRILSKKKMIRHVSNYIFPERGCCCHDLMVVDADHHNVASLGYSIQHYVIKVCTWLAADLWLAQYTPVSSTSKWYNRNIVESGVKYYSPNIYPEWTFVEPKILTIPGQKLYFKCWLEIWNRPCHNIHVAGIQVHLYYHTMAYM
jgi:hypothetical protein